MYLELLENIESEKVNFRMLNCDVACFIKWENNYNMDNKTAILFSSKIKNAFLCFFVSIN